MIERYQTIASDPPWLERGGGKSKRGADRHYPLMGKKDIVRVMRDCGEWRPSASCHLWLWATSNFLRDALWVMGCLGFEYKTSAVWIKVNDEFPRLTVFTDNNGRQWMACEHGQEIGRVCVACGMALTLPDVMEVLNDALQIGLGQYMRHAHEWLLFGTMGKAMVPEPANRMPSVIFAPRTKHSTKPIEAYRLIESTSPGPRLELFARQPRDKWSVWGNEIVGGE